MFRKICIAVIALALVWAPSSPRAARAADLEPGRVATPVMPPSPARQMATCTDTVAPGVPPVQATTGLAGAHAALYARSGFPTLCPGSSATVTIAFLNIGSLGWYGNAGLGTWGPEPGQDRASALGGDGSTGSPATSWSRANRPAIQSTPYIGPGQVMWFQFSVQAPAVAGVYKLGLRPLLEGQQWLEDPNLTFYVLVKADDAHLPPGPATIAPEPARTYLPATLADGSRMIRVPSLMYHYVGWLPATDPNMDLRKDLTVSPTDFEAMLQYLRDNGYHSITTKDLWWSLDQTAPLPTKPVMLTFDDGYADAYSVVMPLLKAYGMTGVFFVTVNLVDKPGYISRAEVKALADTGMDVESHAMDHVSMMKPLSDQTYQMCRARDFLNAWTGTDVRHFAYPSGDYNDQSGAALQTCGYLSAYKKSGGSVQSSNAMYLLQRARVRGQQGLGALLLALQQ
ncbi:MAG TPA: polysaccharide deacetylase family protein [Candidatus Limnocylindria bacterium]|nr:polysaccharide deacetylase family protein [Candidatus Limnocylindria bacterium]